MKLGLTHRQRGEVLRLIGAYALNGDFKRYCTIMQDADACEERAEAHDALERKVIEAVIEMAAEGYAMTKELADAVEALQSKKVCK
jgi:erythromycin esterase-like protein